LFPVAYGVLKAETTESWTWFLEHLRAVIGHPDGLTIHADACKGLEIAIDKVFLAMEHRECMRHLATNFGKYYKGKIYDDNLWPTSLTYSLKKFNFHLNQMYAKPKLKEYMEAEHRKI
jgi:transposase-like protein